jgi:hypothetical protein
VATAEQQRRWREKRKALLPQQKSAPVEGGVASTKANETELSKALRHLASLPPPPKPFGDAEVRKVCGWLIELSDRLDAGKVERLRRDLVALESKYNPPPLEPVRTNEDANDGFGPRVLTPHELRLQALSAIPGIQRGMPAQGGTDGEAAKEIGKDESDLWG